MKPNSSKDEQDTFDLVTSPEFINRVAEGSMEKRKQLVEQAAPQPTSKPESEIREKLAAIEHERWSDWQSYVHSRMKKQGEDGMLMSVDDYLHWEEQIAADYSELTEREKESDREQVDRYWPLIEAHVKEQVTAARISELEAIRKTTYQVFDTKSPFANIRNIENNVIAATSAAVESRLAQLSHQSEKERAA